MIRLNPHWSHFCNGDYTAIENYDKAMADKETVWCIHHRDEIRVLPSGMVARRTVKDLIDAGLYYNLPPEYLIFMPENEHTRMHKVGNNGLKGHRHSEETKRKMSERAKGHKVSEAVKQRLREFHTGLVASEETKERMRKAHTGIKATEETKQRMRESQLRRLGKIS